MRKMTLLLVLALLSCFVGCAHAASEYETLKPGCNGQAVLDARIRLYELGYFRNFPTQTEYTKNMMDYVKKFEKDYGLKQDGILSPEDQEVLFGNTQNETAATEAESKYTTLQPGSKGQAVLDARMRLYELGYFTKVPTQTEYTKNMMDYVKRFEKDFGLEQDGILSPEDQEMLFGKHSSKTIVDADAAYRIGRSSVCTDKVVKKHSVTCSCELENGTFDFSISAVNSSYQEVGTFLSFTEAESLEDINLSLTIGLLNPWRALGNAKPLNLMITVDNETFTYTNWTYASGTTLIDFDEDIELFEKIANSKTTIFSMTFSDISAEVITLTAGQPFHDTVKTGWNVFTASKLDKVYYDTQANSLTSSVENNPDNQWFPDAQNDYSLPFDHCFFEQLSEDIIIDGLNILGFSNCSIEYSANVHSHKLCDMAIIFPSSSSLTTIDLDYQKVNQFFVSKYGHLKKIDGACQGCQTVYQLQMFLGNKQHEFKCSLYFDDQFDIYLCHHYASNGDGYRHSISIYPAAYTIRDSGT